jgi:H+/Cl- antiporter ClcA
MDIIKVILVSLFIGALLFFGPFAPVYVLNVLFGKALAYGFHQWAAGALLGLWTSGVIFSGVHK